MFSKNDYAFIRSIQFYLYVIPESSPLSFGLIANGRVEGILYLHDMASPCMRVIKGNPCYQ